MKKCEGVGIELENATCPRCGYHLATLIFSGQDYLYGIPGIFNVAECSRCHLWFQNPRPTRLSLSSLYPDSYTPHAAAVPEAQPGVPRHTLFGRLARRLWRFALTLLNPVERLAARRARAAALVPHLIPGGSILEIGCAAGARLLELRRQGWQNVNGIEMVPAAAARARALGFRVECAMVEQALDVFADRSLDAVVSSMVLEHLHDPFSVVNKIAAKLKPGGQFLFSTIVRDSLDARIFGSYWAGFDFPRHMVYLSRRDLRALLSAEFRTVRLVHQAAPIDFVRSASWRIAAGEHRPVDRLFLAMDQGVTARILSLVLASIGWTTRVSIYCERTL